MLSTSEWELINKMVLRLYQEGNSYAVRKTFLENLRVLIDFDVAEFSLVNQGMQLHNSAEVNFYNDETMHIALTYNRCKALYGIESTDYIFRYPESFIACNLTTRLRGDSYEKSKFHTLFLKSIKMDYCCTMTIKTEGLLIAEMSLYCASEPDFSEKDVYILSQFKDHLTFRLSQFHGPNNAPKLSRIQMDFLEEKHLTEREIQIAEMIFSDVPNFNIAQMLYISANTLKKHSSNIYRKLGVSSRKSAAADAFGDWRYGGRILICL